MTNNSKIINSVKVNGDEITSDLSYMKGHGTFETVEGTIAASTTGYVELVNKLLMVHSLHSKYRGDTGDVVVGRVVAISQKRWIIDIQGKQLGQLMLTSIGLPDGVQRRKTEEDELQMRTYFKENDVIVAEVQQVNHTGVVNLQTRNSRYGKLENGILVKVQPNLVMTCASHFLELNDTKVILGKNGFIWIEGVNYPVQSLLFNILKALNSQNLPISDSSIQKAISLFKNNSDPLLLSRSIEGIDLLNSNIIK